MDPILLLLLVAGFGIYGAVVLERPLRRLGVPLPVVYVGLGWALFALPLGLPRFDPAGVEAHAVVAEVLTKVIVVASLMAAGVAIDRPLSWRGWRQVWPLLGITMPLTIGAVALFGWAGLGLAPASAVLLGAALAPTDPVLARSVEVGPPGEGDRHDVRFDLTVEAGLNDGLAFPFTHLAVAALGVAGLGGWTLEWLAVDVVWRIAAGVAVGAAVGRLGAWYVFEKSGEGEGGEPTHEGLVVIGATLIAYGLAEAVAGYGFLAVFAAAVAARQREAESEYHVSAHHFMDQVEQVVLVVMLLAFGGLLASGVLAALTWPGALLGLAVVFVVRPLAGLAGLLQSGLPWAGRGAVAFLGVRGAGSVYYLAYGQTHAAFEGLDVLWAVVAFTILVSVVVHGLSAEPLLAWAERRGAHVDASAPDDVLAGV